MSFTDLLKADFKRAEKSFVVKSGDKELTFKAIELPYFHKIEISGLRANGQPWLEKFVSYTIVDAHGAKMTEQQAAALPEEYANLFITEALAVNNFNEESDKKK